jgi:hypothetical protein
VRPAAATAFVAAVLGIIAAVSPWLKFSLLGVTAHIHGTDPGLHGHIALGLAITALVVALIVGIAGERRWSRIGGLAAFLLLGLAGLGLMQRQARYLTSDVQARMQRTGLGIFKAYLGQRTTTAWGFWLEVAAFASLIVLPPLAYGVTRAYNRRSAPPSTGITQPVRYDAAGDSANAAT